MAEGSCGAADRARPSFTARAAQIWSVESALLLASCRGHQGEVTDLAISADNSIVASSSNDAVIRCWSLQVGHTESGFAGFLIVRAAIHAPIFRNLL